MIDLNDDSTNCGGSIFDEYYPRVGATGGSLSDTYNFGYMCGGKGVNGSFENMCTFFNKNGFYDDDMESTRFYAGLLHLRF